MVTEYMSKTKDFPLRKSRLVDPMRRPVQLLCTELGERKIRIMEINCLVMEFSIVANLGFPNRGNA